MIFPEGLFLHVTGRLLPPSKAWPNLAMLCLEDGQNVLCIVA